MSELAFVLLVSLTVPGRPLLDMLDGFLESKETVEDSLFWQPLFFFLFHD